jgi:hydroxymethylpyrimidine/phosphomethylpyrimidine kinase
MSAGGQPAVALTIGGSDSGGACGVQADLRTFARIGVHGTCALTVVTAQNTCGIHGAQPLSAEFVQRQIDAVLSDYRVAAVKTGMLPTVEIVVTVGRLAAAGRLPNLVVDPVLVNAAGAAAFGPDLTDAYRRHLLPHALVVTPNLPEACLLTGDETGAPADAVAQHLAGLAARADLVVVTGGRAPGAAAAGGGEATTIVTDVVVTADLHVSHLSGPRVDTPNVAGTGDTLSAALAGLLAQGCTPAEGLGQARAVVAVALAGAAHWRLGAGSGPLDQLGWGTA